MRKVTGIITSIDREKKEMVLQLFEDVKEVTVNYAEELVQHLALGNKIHLIELPNATYRCAILTTEEGEDIHVSKIIAETAERRAGK